MTAAFQPGMSGRGKLIKNIKSAHIILLLISPDFIASDYCYDVELTCAMMRHQKGKARVIPVIVRPVDWRDAPFGELQALPMDGKPVSLWDNQDEAWASVGEGIRAVIGDLTQGTRARQRTHPEPSEGRSFGTVTEVEQGADLNNQPLILSDNQTKEIELTIDRDFDTYSEQDKELLLGAIAKLLKIEGSEVKIKKVRRGSVKIIIELPAKQAEHLYQIVKGGGLEGLDVIDAELQGEAASSSKSIPGRAQPSKHTRVMLVDDHEVIRMGLRVLIQKNPLIEVVGEASDSKEAINLAAEVQPDLILLDGESFLECLPALLRSAPATRVLVLAGLSDERLNAKALRAGAMGLVLKEKAGEVLLKAIEMLTRGEVWFDRTTMGSTTMGSVLSESSRGGGRAGEDPEAVKIASLTDREREVVTLIGEGLKNKNIAERLFISETTVRHHLTSIFDKLGVSDRLELVIYAYRHNLAKPPR